jgi:hypothetical protein
MVGEGGVQQKYEILFPFSRNSKIFLGLRM